MRPRVAPGVVQIRIDETTAFQHEVHDGVYYMTTCGGGFRLLDRPEQRLVEVVGIGYVTPCENAATDACLEVWFSTLLSRRSDPTAIPPPPGVLATREAAGCSDGLIDIFEVIKTLETPYPLVPSP